MEKLWESVIENLGFVGICIAMIAGLYILSKLSELKMHSLHRITPARRISIIGICAALAAVLHILDFPLLFLGITSLLQVPVAWASNRKIAYVELAAGGALVIMSILDLFI